MRSLRALTRVYRGNSGCGLRTREGGERGRREGREEGEGRERGRREGRELRVGMVDFTTNNTNYIYRYYRTFIRVFKVETVFYLRFCKMPDFQQNKQFYLHKVNKLKCCFDRCDWSAQKTWAGQTEARPAGVLRKPSGKRLRGEEEFFFLHTCHSPLCPQTQQIPTADML